MITQEAILYFFGTAAGIWMLGYSWGKAVSWVRHLTNAA